MGNEVPLVIDQIGITTDTEMNISDHFPEKLKVRLRRENPNNISMRVLERKRDGHVRLGLIRRVDRAYIGIAADSFLKFSRSALVETLAWHINFSSRYLNDLSALQVQYGDLGKGLIVF